MKEALGEGARRTREGARAPREGARETRHGARTARLARLGIDVWVRRRPRAALPAKPPVKARAAIENRPPKPPAAPAKPRRRAEPSPPAPGPAAAEPFRIHCHRVGDVFLAIGEDAMPMRRFLLDVAAAVSGLPRSDEARSERVLVFEWPQPGAAPDGHERAYRAFFLRQMARCVRALLAGQRPATLLGHPPPQASGPLGAHFHIAPRPLDGAGKKRLWDELCAWTQPR